LTLAASPPSSSRLPTVTRWVKSPEAISFSRVDLADRPNHGQGDRAAEDQGEDDRAEREADDDRPRGAISLAARLNARHDVGLGLVDQLIGQTLEPVRQRARLLELRLPRFVDVPGADLLDDPRHDGNEPFVFVPDLAEQLDFVLGDELQPFEVIAKLVELTQRTVQGTLVGDQQRGGDAVELARRVVLHLAVSRDLALALDQLLGALVDRAQLVEPGSSERDQQCDDREKRRQQLGLRATADARPGRPEDG
jgi:hypothetical protein